MRTIGVRREAGVSGVRRRTGPLRAVFPLSPLALPVLGSSLLYLALFVLLQAPSLRLTQTPTAHQWGWLRDLLDRVTPQTLRSAGWTDPRAAIHECLYAVIAVGLVATWVMALWLARPGQNRPRLRWVLLPILLFSLPLTLLPGLFSGDIYLYVFYGRIISHYGENPLLMAPGQFPGDPYLPWVFWTWLPSGYGPLWLMFSGALGAIAGESLLANLLTYKAALLAVHLLTTVVVWTSLRDSRPELATWGAIFYGWNPLALLETAGNGHNDALIALFLAMALLAVTHSRWLMAIFFLTAAASVKLSAILFLPPLALVWALTLPGARARIRAVSGAITVAVLGGIALYAPLWAGTALLANIRANPAATEYQNSLWQFLLLRLAQSGDGPALLALADNMDPLRNLAFVTAFLVFMYHGVWKRRDLPGAWVWLWFAYCVTLSWIWPWYFLLVIPVAALQGPGRSAALAAGLTLGGMLFWLGWPEPALPAAPWLFEYRSFLLLAPAIAVAVLPALSRRVEQAMGREVLAK